MANRVKIIIENDSDWSLAATGEGNHFVLSSGALEAGSNLPPLLLEPKQRCNLTVSTPPGSPGPDGFVPYEFATLKLQVWIIWDDSNVKPGKATPNEEGEMVAAGIVNPFHLQWRQLDGAVGDFDPVSVTLTTEKGKDLSFDKAFGVDGLVAKYVAAGEERHGQRRPARGDDRRRALGRGAPDRWEHVRHPAQFSHLGRAGPQPATQEAPGRHRQQVSADLRGTRGEAQRDRPLRGIALSADGLLGARQRDLVHLGQRHGGGPPDQGRGEMGLRGLRDETGLGALGRQPLEAHAERG